MDFLTHQPTPDNGPQPTYDGTSLLLDKSGRPIPPDRARAMIEGGAGVRPVTVDDMYQQDAEIEPLGSSDEFGAVRGDVETERDEWSGLPQLRIAHVSDERETYRGVIIEPVMVHHVQSGELFMSAVLEDVDDTGGIYARAAGMPRLLFTPEPPIQPHDPGGPRRLKHLARQEIGRVIARLSHTEIEARN